MINVNRSIKPYQDLCAIVLLPHKSVTKTATNCRYRRRIAACKLVLHGHAPGCIAENDRARRAASPSRRTEKSQLNTVAIYELRRRRHVGNEMPWEIVGVNILWHVCDITRAYMYVRTRTRVHLRRRIAGLQCSKMHGGLSASATTCRRLGAHSRHLLFNHCDATTTRRDVFLIFTCASYIAATRYIMTRPDAKILGERF